MPETPGDEANRQRQPCPVCNDSGRLADHPCLACDGGAAYWLSRPVDPEAERIARELSILLA